MKLHKQKELDQILNSIFDNTMTKKQYNKFRNLFLTSNQKEQYTMIIKIANNTDYLLNDTNFKQFFSIDKLFINIWINIIDNTKKPELEAC